MTRPAKDGIAGRERPAAVPPDTDEKAAGTSPAQEEAEAAQRMETERAAGDGSRPAPVVAADHRSPRWKGTFVLAAAVLVIAGLLVWLFSIR